MGCLVEVLRSRVSVGWRGGGVVIVGLVGEVLRRFDGELEPVEDWWLDGAVPVHREEGFEVWVECVPRRVPSSPPAAVMGAR